MSPTHRIDPRIRALGKARIDVTRRARDEQEWQRMWHAPRFPFPFSWGQGLKHCIQYVVDDFAAEVGFFIDVLGFPVSAFSPNYAQFTTPDEDIYFGVVSANENATSTPPDSLRIQFLVRGLQRTISELEQRGVQFELRPDSSDTAMQYAVFRSPHGVGIELLGVIEPAAVNITERVPSKRKPEREPEPEPAQSLEDSLDAFWEDDPEEAEPQPVISGRPAPILDEELDDEADSSNTGDEFDDDEPVGEKAPVLDEPVYEDVDDPMEPSPIPVLKPHPAPAPRQPQPTPRQRSLDVPLEPRSVIRTRNNRLNGGSRYPPLDDRNNRA